MEDSMQLFESIANNVYFEHSAIMLFFNKKDIFEEKIKKSPLTICFPNYKGVKDSYDETTTYIKEKFERLNHSAETKHFYFHFTCGISTENMRYVVNSVTDYIINRNLKACGL